MPPVDATATSVTVPQTLFEGAPLNLPGGSKLYCRYHSMSKSRWGWGTWSTSNDAFTLRDCNPPTLDPLAEEEIEEDFQLEEDLPCANTGGCALFGRGGNCCGNKASAGETFWNKAANKGCCATGACKCGKP